MEIAILGAGTPTPSAKNWGSSFVVELEEQRIMFDCGPGATSKMVKSGTLPTQVGAIFLSHLHFDHVVDVPALLLSRWDQGAGLIDPIEVYGPPPTGRFIEDIAGPDGLFRDDIRARIELPGSQAVFMNRGGTLPRGRPRHDTTEMDPGGEARGEGWKVTAAYAQHAQPFLECLAYRIDTDFGSVVFTGDTEPCETVVDLARGADILFSMCWDLEESMKANREHAGQTGSTGAGQLAAESGVKKLVLVHHGPQLDNAGLQAAALEEASSNYDGAVVFGDEGMKLSL
jgi:ribonuclease Z